MRRNVLVPVEKRPPRSYVLHTQHTASFNRRPCAGCLHDASIYVTATLVRLNCDASWQRPYRTVSCWIRRPGSWQVCVPFNAIYSIIDGTIPTNASGLMLQQGRGLTEFVPGHLCSHAASDINTVARRVLCLHGQLPLDHWAIIYSNSLIPTSPLKPMSWAILRILCALQMKIWMIDWLIEVYIECMME